MFLTCLYDKHFRKSFRLSLPKFDEVFSGYQPRQVSVLNRRFDLLGHHHQIPDVDDRDGRIQSPWMLKNIYLQMLFQCSYW